jgi:hypothetical protein
MQILACVFGFAVASAKADPMVWGRVIPDFIFVLANITYFFNRWDLMTAQNSRSLASYVPSNVGRFWTAYRSNVIGKQAEKERTHANER